MSKDIYKARAQVACRVRHGQPTEEARRDLAAAKLAQYISKVIAEAPPLSPAVLDKLAGLLHSKGGAA